jgi:uncharacterized protein
VSARADSFDLAALKLASGEGRALELEVPLAPFELGGERYAASPALVPTRLDVSRTTHAGYALRMRFEVTIDGPCMRCLESAHPRFAVDAREIEQPGGGEELESPYVEEEQLDLAAWAHDALALALPAQLLCQPDCPGLCPVCGESLRGAGRTHEHESGPDPRWAKLRELKL